jgi:hypothetical protein
MYFNEILENTLNLNLGDKLNIKGCSVEEINTLESYLKFKLPNFYKDYLLNLGHDAGKLFKDENFFYNDLLEKNLKNKAQKLLIENNSDFKLSDNAFIFGMTNLSEFWYVLINEDKFDIPVYFYSIFYKDTENNYPFIHYDSLYEFFFSMIKLYKNLKEDDSKLKHNYRLQQKKYDEQMIIDIKNKMLDYGFDSGNFSPVFLGCSEDEIIKLEKILSLKLPKLYRDFLTYFGHRFGTLFSSGYFDYNYVLSNAIHSIESSALDFNEIVVFYNIDATFFIEIDEIDDNPPVYFSHESNENKKFLRYATLYQFYLGIMDSKKGLKKVI